MVSIFIKRVNIINLIIFKMFVNYSVLFMLILFFVMGWLNVCVIILFILWLIMWLIIVVDVDNILIFNKL